MFPEGSRVIPIRTAPRRASTWTCRARADRRAACLPARRAGRNDRDVARLGGRGDLRSCGGGRPGDPPPADQLLRGRREPDRVDAARPDPPRPQPTVGINASKATIILRIAAEGATRRSACADGADRRDDPPVPRHAGFGEEDDELAGRRGAAACASSGQTLATAEWGTGGLVADGWESTGAEGRFSRRAGRDRRSRLSTLASRRFRRR